MTDFCRLGFEIYRKTSAVVLLHIFELSDGAVPV